MQSELVWDAACRLGTGPVWQARDASLYFVDPEGGEALALTPAGGVQRRWAVPQGTGWLVERRRGGWLAGLAQGVAALDFEPELRHEALHALHDEVATRRLSDAKADAQGRLWFGTQTTRDAARDPERDPDRPDGALYRWDGAGLPEGVDTGYRLPSGPAFSLDGGTLYQADSLARTIFSFDVAASGTLSNKRVLVEFNRYEGEPHGMTTDATGHLWVAHWGGSRVTQRDARSGRVLRTVVVPAPHVSGVAFGGPALSDLYITTARSGIGESALAQSPQSGALFVARGVGPGRFAGVFDG